MRLLVAAATQFEIAPFLAGDNDVEILITGVGAPACMYALTKRLQRNDIDFVIQAGIAGSFKRLHKLGSTVAVKADVFADLGISENNEFFTLFEKGFAEIDVAPFKNGWLENSFELEVLLPAVNAVTVNTISDKEVQTNQIIKKFNPDIETMEGAACHYVCLSEQIPFLQIRSISNVVGDRNKGNWKMKESIDDLNIHLNRIVEFLQNSNTSK